MAMGSSGDCPLPVPIVEVGPGSLTSSTALYRFVWVARRLCLFEAALHVVPGRAALALWIGGLEISEFGESGFCVTTSGDERMLDWIMLSVRHG